jgi:KipI family sensor histidine kinase inhibitor
MPTAGKPTPGPPSVRLLPMGDSAVLVETDDIDGVLAMGAALTPLVEAGEGIWAEVDDLVPAARTLLVVARPTTDLATLRRTVVDAIADALADRAAGVGPTTTGQGELLEVPVRYDGPDLDEVARQTGLRVAEVVAAHTGRPWRVAFGGFSPGFAYLVGGDPRLEVARRAEPRTRVPAGSVALAGRFSGVYPRESPGGWQVIGRTDAVLWDVTRTPPALLVPGLTVRFTEAGP